MFQQTLAILLVLALLAGTLFLLRKKGVAQFPIGMPRSANRARQMQVIERLSLTPHHSLHLVTIREDIFVVGVSPSGLNVVANLAGPGDAAAVREVS